MSILIALGTDHRGYALKEFLKQQHEIKGLAVRWNDLGAYAAERTDYPPYAQAVVQQILDRRADYGILLCGSGVGMAVAANRYKGIYAGVAWNERVARQMREDDGCNILVVPADYSNASLMLNMIHCWLTASFKGGRYAERLSMVDAI